MPGRSTNLISRIKGWFVEVVSLGIKQYLVFEVGGLDYAFTDSSHPLQH